MAEAGEDVSLGSALRRRLREEHPDWFEGDDTPYEWRCGHCGRFLALESQDVYTPWGCANYDAPEPYDPVYLCRSCSLKLRDELVAEMLAAGAVRREDKRPYWHSPRAWYEAKSIVRAVLRHRNAWLKTPKGER